MPRKVVLHLSFVVFAFICLVETQCAQAQVPDLSNITVTPQPGGHHYLGTVNETVNPANGLPSFRLTLDTPPGRGLNLPISIAYDAGSVYLQSGGYGNSDPWVKGGWSFTVPRLTWQTSSITLEDDIQAVSGFKFVTCSYQSDYMFTDLAGSQHPLYIGQPLYQTNISPCSQLGPGNNTGGDDFVQAYADANWNVFVTDASGTVYEFDNNNEFPSYIEDRNGNRITISGNNVTQAFTVTDTLGRNLLSTSGFGSGMNTIHISGVPDYTVVWETITPTFSLNQWWGDGTHQSSQQIARGVPFNVIKEIDLPQCAALTTNQVCGTKYTFQYDSTYGLLSQINYPGGGSVAYTWGTNEESDSNYIAEFIPDSTGNTSGQTISLAYRHSWPAVKTRAVSFVGANTDGTSTALQQSFAYSTLNWTSNDFNGEITLAYWGNKQTSVTSVDKVTGQTTNTIYNYGKGGGFKNFNDTIANIPLYEASQVPVEQSILYQDGNGNTLRTINKTWDDYNLLTGQQTVLENGKTSQQTFSYLKDYAAGGGIPTETDEYDYDQPAPSRRTVTTYHQFPALPTFPNPDFPTLLNRPDSVITYDSTGKVAAETDYTYDEGSIGLEIQGLTGHDVTNYSASSTAPRGNATTKTRKCFIPGGQTCPDQVSHYTYDETGQLITATDPRGNTTTYFYADSYAEGTAPGTTNAYPTTITNALNQSIQYQWRYDDGLMANTTDLNKNQTLFAYNDPLLRLTDITYPPGGGNTHVDYNDTAPSWSMKITKTRDSSGDNVVTNTVYDGMGHEVQSQLTSDPDGTDFTDTVYDGLGRVHSVSNAYRSTSDSTYGITTTLYDPIGRVHQVNQPDGSVIKTDYSGNQTTVTDEAENQRRSVTDGLGRLIQVDEPGDSYGATPATAPMALNGTLLVATVGATPPQISSGWVTISGLEQSIVDTSSCEYVNGKPTHCPTIWDAGTVTVTLNGIRFTANYGAASTQNGLATLIASAINQPLYATQFSAQANGNIVTLTGCSCGDQGNYSLSISVSTSKPGYFSPSFNVQASGSSLTGGTWGNPGTTVYDSGTVTATVKNGSGQTIWTSNSVPYGLSSLSGPQAPQGSGAVPTAVVAALADALSAQGSPVTATPSQIVAVTPGTGSNGLIVNFTSVSSNPSVFPTASFSGSATLMGGSPAGQPSSLALPYTTLYSYDILGNLLCVEQHGDAPSGTGCSADPSNDTASPWRIRRFNYNSLSQLLTARNPETGLITYTYDLDGNVATKTDARGITATYSYEPLNRIKQVVFSNGDPTITETYDQGAAGTNPIGHRTGMSDGIGLATWTFDNVGRMVTEQRTVTPGQGIVAVTKSTGFQYDLLGEVTQITYPSGRVVNYGFSNAGHPISATDANGTVYVRATSYWPNGSRFQLHALGFYASTTLNNRLQPSYLYSDDAHGTVFVSNSYNYPTGHNNGNIQSIVNGVDNNRSQSFTYDMLNRLTSASSQASSGSFSWGENYTIDPWGNLQISPMTGKAGGGSFQHASTVNNQVIGFSYDSAGDVLSDGANHYTYNGYGQVATATSASGGIVSYAYNGDGERTIKSQGGAPYEIYWAGSGSSILSESDGSGNVTADYIFLGGERVARVDVPSNMAHYYWSDHLHSTGMIVRLVNGVRTLQEQSDYMPFGREIPVFGSDTNHYKFTGKERDSESGLDYFGARYYSSTSGSFIQPDWSAKATGVPYADFTNPQSLNLYGYVGGNPIRRFDADGHAGLWDDIKTAAAKTFQNVGVGFIGLVLFPDQSAKGTAEGVKTAAIAYGTSEGRSKLAQGVTREDVLEATFTSTATVAPGVLGGAAAGSGAGIQSLEDLPSIGTAISKQNALGAASSNRVVVSAISRSTGESLAATSVGVRNIGDVHPTLAALAEQQLGGVGAKTPGVIGPVGCCAEFQAANGMLQEGFSLDDLDLTGPTRGGEPVGTCTNCGILFPKHEEN